MRSQIACSHCRRSKVKCVNTGTDSVCKACQNSNRECTYPEAGSSGPRKESIVDRTGEAPRAKNKRKINSGAQALYPTKKQMTPARGNDPLDWTILTPQVWNELFDIFQQHYATDLPFLHVPTFRNEVQQLPPMLLLSFLTLTARFHPLLVERNGRDPIKAAEYYRKAARPHIATQRLSGVPKLMDIQALLMLGLHDWGMARGASAWRLIGDAIRCATLLGLHSEPHLDEEPDACATSNSQFSSVHGKLRPQSRKMELIENEVRRRTFWSCFIMDRYLSFNKDRTPTLQSEYMRVQLPCSDSAFIFGHEVDTMMLNEEEEDAKARFREQNQLRRAEEQLVQERFVQENGKGMNDLEMAAVKDKPRQEIGEQEGILSRYIRAIDLLGRVIRWACTGGRRRKQDIKYGPWNHKSTFWKLEHELKELRRTLPADLILTSDNTSAHIHNRTSRHYTLMHVGHLLCSIALYREYMAFLPFDVPKPIGPLDEPKIPESELHALPGPDYWDNQARDCFGAARNLVDLLHACKMANVLIQTPLTGFATWQAVTCAVYCRAFPNMDVDSSLNIKRSRSTSDMSGIEARNISIDMLKDMKKVLHMVDGWCMAEISLHGRIEKTRQKKAHGTLEGYGLTEYLEMEKLLKEFGDCRIYQEDDEDANMVDSSPEPKDQEEATTELGSNLLKRENWDVDKSQRADTVAGTAWNAVNHDQPSVAKAEIESKPPGMSNSFQQHLGTQMTTHPIHESKAEGYHQYAPSNNQHHVSSYGPITAESAPRASLKNLQSGPNQVLSTSVQAHGHADLAEYPDNLHCGPFHAGPECAIFSGGYGHKEMLSKEMFTAECWTAPHLDYAYSNPIYPSHA